VETEFGEEKRTAKARLPSTPAQVWNSFTRRIGATSKAPFVA
jgi:hypothetical protein